MKLIRESWQCYESNRINTRPTQTYEKTSESIHRLCTCQIV